LNLQSLYTGAIENRSDCSRLTAHCLLMATTDKMNDLNAVFILKQSRLPVVTTNYIPVEFNGDSRWFKTEGRYQ
jgi:hypothetical protein